MQDILDAPDNTIICYCGNINKGSIVRAIKEGHTSFAQLRAATGVCPEPNDCLHNNPKGRCCSTEVMALLNSVCGVNKTAVQASPCTCACCKNEGEVCTHPL